MQNENLLKKTEEGRNRTTQIRANDWIITRLRLHIKVESAKGWERTMKNGLKGLIRLADFSQLEKPLIGAETSSTSRAKTVKERQEAYVI